MCTFNKKSDDYSTILVFFPTKLTISVRIRIRIRLQNQYYLHYKHYNLSKIFTVCAITILFKRDGEVLELMLLIQLLRVSRKYRILHSNL